MDQNASRELLSPLMQRFPRINLPEKKRVTSGIRNCVAQANAPRRFATPSESGCDSGICDPVTITWATILYIVRITLLLTFSLLDIQQPGNVRLDIHIPVCQDCLKQS